MGVDRRRRHGDDVRRRAVALIGAGVSVRHHIASIAPLERWCREYRAGGGRRGAAAPGQGPAPGVIQRAGAGCHARAGAGRAARVPGGEGRLPGKIACPAGVEVTRRDKAALAKRLAGQGHRLAHLLAVSGLARSTYYRLLSRPAHVTGPTSSRWSGGCGSALPTGAGTGRCACAWCMSSARGCRPRACSGSCAAWAFDASYAVPTHGAATTRTGARAAPRYEL